MLDRLDLDLDAARLHLELIANEANPVVCWQVFDDSNTKPSLARSFHGRLDDVLPKLKKAQADGCGVFVAVNATDGKGRKIGNMVHARAVFLDLDGAPLPGTWPIEPDLIVHSSSVDGVDKFQCWWLIEPTDDWDRWQRTQKAMALKYGGDLKCSMITQVGRLAGFWHQKDRSQPWRVAIMPGGASVPALRWMLDDLVGKFGFELDAIPAPGTQRELVDRPPPIHGWDNDLDVVVARRLVADEANWTPTSDGGFSIYKMACRVRDLGISEGLAVELIEASVPVLPRQAMHDSHYIRTKVANAYRYARNQAGAESIEAGRQEMMMFDTSETEAEARINWQAWFRKNWVPIGQRGIDDLPHTPWLVEGLLLYGDVTTIGGRGGSGKSLLGWQIGISVATGRSLAWWGKPDRPRKVLVISGEDSVDEIERRVSAACKAMGVKRSDLGDNFMVWNDRIIRLAMKNDKTGTVVLTELYKGIRWAVENLDIGLIIADPLIKGSTGFEEQRNDHMDELYGLVRNLISGHACAALTVDHFAKAGTGGDQASIRGASAKVDAARVAITLTAMTEKEHGAIRPPRPREAYVLCIDAKQNYARKTGGHWMELVDHDVGNGEQRPSLVWRDLSAGEFHDPQLWPHRAAFLQLVAEGREDGQPWSATLVGRSEARLDIAVAEKFGLTRTQAIAWIEAFDSEGSITTQEQKRPNRTFTTVWVINPDYQTEEDTETKAMRD